MVLTDDQKALQETARRFARERLLPDYQKREKLGDGVLGRVHVFDSDGNDPAPLDVVMVLEASCCRTRKLRLASASNIRMVSLTCAVVRSARASQSAIAFCRAE